MVTTKLNLSMTEPSVRQIYAKQGDTGRVLDITLDQTPEDGTLRILRPDGVEVTSEAVTGGEISESGETVSFESLTEADVTELTVGIEPVQDLNGYDKPWVGGAGKNKLNNTQTTTTYNGVTFTVNSDGTVTANGTASGDASIIVRVDTSSVYGDFYFNALYGYTSDTSYNAYMWDTTTGARCKQWDGTTNSINSYNGTLRQVKIVQGNSVYMTCRVMNGVTANNVVFYPMIVASTETDPTWQPYSNICPITGHDEVRVTDVGKNLCAPRDTASNIYNAGHLIPVTQGETIYVYGEWTSTTSNQLYVRVFDDKNATNKNADGANPGGNYFVSETVVSVTIPRSGYFGVCYNSGVSSYTVNKMMVSRVPITSYEPYQGSTYTTSLGQTVYGGTLDMVSGVLTVDRAEYQLSDMTASLVSGNRWFFTSLQGVIEIPSSTSVATTTISDRFVAMSNVEMANTTNIGMSVNTQGNLVVRNGSSTDQPTGQIVIPLATPLTYTLTAQQIKTLVGTNNVWASSGDIVSIKFTYGGLLSELPSDATSIVGKCYCDVEQNGVSSMPFTLNVKKNERQ